MTFTLRRLGSPSDGHFLGSSAVVALSTLSRAPRSRPPLRLADHGEKNTLWVNAAIGALDSGDEARQAAPHEHATALPPRQGGTAGRLAGKQRATG
jgi:hypothetical protein